VLLGTLSDGISTLKLRFPRPRTGKTHDILKIQYTCALPAAIRRYAYKPECCNVVVGIYIKVKQNKRTYGYISTYNNIIIYTLYGTAARVTRIYMAIIMRDSVAEKWARFGPRFV